MMDGKPVLLLLETGETAIAYWHREEEALREGSRSIRSSARRQLGESVQSRASRFLVGSRDQEGMISMRVIPQRPSLRR
jgi:hypothetical protein